MRLVIRAGASLLFVLGFAGQALAQRPAQTPSSEFAIPSVQVPPPPGMIVSPCGAAIVCGGEFTAQPQAFYTSPNGGKVQTSADANLDLYANYRFLSLYSTLQLERRIHPVWTAGFT